MAPLKPPPSDPFNPWLWIHRNLLSTWYNVLLTLLCIVGLIQAGRGAIAWIVAANWAVIPANLQLFLVGRYPGDLVWRLWLILVLLVGMGGLTWARPWLERRHPLHLKPWMLVLWVLLFPLILWLIGGGLGLEPVATNLWTGLLLTLLMALISIGLSFPLGVVLALGRQSPLPVLRWSCVTYIELIRGVPLIGVLFMAQVMVPLFLPVGVRPDRVLRAIAGLTLFSAAYLAENVRGGLQSIPRGQIEAARALGLNPLLITGLIVLPQALRAVIPAIVGQFIGLFKDTTLLAIVGLAELMGIARSVLANPRFLGNYGEVYLFVGLIYWTFCIIMSLVSQKLEQSLAQRGY